MSQDTHEAGKCHFHMWLLKGSASGRCHSQVWRGHSWGSATMCVAEPVLICVSSYKPLLIPHPWGSSGAESESGQNSLPMRLSDAELRLYGKSVPEELME